MTAALKQFAWTAYDHMGRLFLLNLLWSGLSLPWFGLGMLIFVLGAGMGEWGFLGGCCWRWIWCWWLLLRCCSFWVAGAGREVKR